MRDCLRQGWPRLLCTGSSDFLGHELVVAEPQEMSHDHEPPSARLALIGWRWKSVSKLSLWLAKNESRARTPDSIKNNHL